MRDRNDCNADRERRIVQKLRKLNGALGRIRGIGWRRELQQKKRPLRRKVKEECVKDKGVLKTESQERLQSWFLPDFGGRQSDEWRKTSSMKTTRVEK